MNKENKKKILSERIENFCQKAFPARQILLKSNDKTVFFNLKSSTQTAIACGMFCLIAWSIFSIAVITMDSLGAGNFREQAIRDQENYQLRLMSLAEERDYQQDSSRQTQIKFEKALAHISKLQEELMEIEIERKELTSALNIVKSTLSTSRLEEIKAKKDLSRLKLITNSGSSEESNPKFSTITSTDKEALLSKVLSETAGQRDMLRSEAYAALQSVKNFERDIKLIEHLTEQIFRLIEEALSVSVGPLDKMFRAAGVNPDSVIETIRRGYSGYGGHDLSFLDGDGETALNIYDKNVEKASRILKNLDELNLYRIAIEKYPFYHPVQTSNRFTSGFGPRWGRMHNGTDFAAPHGTPIRATADGTVVYVGWQSAYGRLIKIKHDFGIETRYAHLSKFRVKKGQRVSRGQHIGDMGNTGRSTGTHLHYEIRIGGKAINPMKYIKAAKNVF
ncbi:MAG: DUF5930 domain-containing protein [Paracoccaceae bacterium]